jgi:hypothetical protein
MKETLRFSGEASVDEPQAMGAPFVSSPPIHIIRAS